MANDSVARAMAATAMSETPIYTSDLINDGNGASPFSIVSETGHRIDLECNTADYKLVAKLYDKNNNLLNTSTEIDLPLESLVVNVQYDSANQKLIVTLKNGTTIDVPLSGLITGLATQTWVQSQGYLTQHQSLDGKQDVLPNIVIQLAQIISQNPITILLTNELAALMEKANNSMIKLDLTAVGMSVNYWKKSFISGNNIIFEDTVDNLTQGQISYNTTNKQGVYTTKQIQGKLTAGENITISNNVISATGGGADNTFVCTFTGTSFNVTSCDKTFAEIRAAALAKKKVLGYLGTDYVYELVSGSGMGCIFASVHAGYQYRIIVSSGNSYTTQLLPFGTVVSGTNDGTNWSSITIGGTTRNIPSGGSVSGAVRYDAVQSLTLAQLNQVYSNIGLGCSRNITTLIPETTNNSTLTSDWGCSGLTASTIPTLTVGSSYHVKIEITGGSKPGTFEQDAIASTTRYITLASVSGRAFSQVRLGLGCHDAYPNNNWMIVSTDGFSGCTAVKLTILQGTNTPISSDLLPSLSVPDPLQVSVIKTGTAANNYFQSQKFRGEGDASSYYHAVDFGYGGHNKIEFYEYGGEYVFNQCTSGEKQDVTELLKITQSDVTYKGTSLLSSGLPACEQTTPGTYVLQCNVESEAAEVVSWEGEETGEDNIDLNEASVDIPAGFGIGSKLSIECNINGTLITITDVECTDGDENGYWFLDIGQEGISEIAIFSDMSLVTINFESPDEHTITEFSGTYEGTTRTYSWETV